MDSPDVGRAIEHIFLIEFHHKLGPRVEYMYPTLPTDELPPQWREIPFICLPDGSHNCTEDRIFFHVNGLPETGISSLYGVACYRQIDAEDLINKSEEVTRSYVQKSVCVLCKQPLYGLLAEKMSVVCQTLFEQRDFTSIDILRECYEQVNATMAVTTTKLDDTQIYEGMSFRSLVIKMRHKLLIIFKAMLLQKRILCTSFPVKELTSCMVSLVSLLPDYFKESLHVKSDADEKLQMLGFPLPIFDENNVYNPFVGLQSIDILRDPKINGFLLGATNGLFKLQSNTDVFVDFEINALEIWNKDLNQVLNLTTADLRFVNSLILSVEENQTDGGVGWIGSDGWIRQEFRNYTCCYLATLLESYNKGSDLSACNDWGSRFTSEFMNTKLFLKWKKRVNPKILNEPDTVLGHPNAGALTMADVGLKFRSQFHDDLKDMDQKKEQLGKSIASAWNSMFNSTTSESEAVTGKDIMDAYNDENRTEDRNTNNKPEPED